MMSAERPPLGRQAALRGGLLCLLGAAALYLLSAAPVVQGFDSAELTAGAVSLGFVHPPGYPLYLLAAQLFLALPAGDPGQQLNLMSAALGALTVAGLYWLILDQSGDRAAAMLGAGLLAVAPTFWSQALRAEVYTLHGLLTVGALLASRHALRTGRRAPLVLACLILGASLANHQTTALLWAALLAALALLPPRQRAAGAAGTALGLGLTALIYLLYFGWRAPAGPAIDYVQPYFAVDLGSPGGLIWMLSGRAFSCGFGLRPGLLAQDLGRLALLLLNGSLGVGLVLAAWGWRDLARREPTWTALLSLYGLLSVAAFLGYQAVDKEVMFAPLLMLVALWAAEGLARLRRRAALRASPQARPVPWLTAGLAAGLVAATALNWGAVSLRESTRVYSYGRALLDQLPPGATVVSTWVSTAMIDYLQVVEGRRPDVRSLSLELYLLGRGLGCSDGAAAQEATTALLARLLTQGPLCVTTPTVPAPAGRAWAQDGLCYTLRAR